MVQSNINSESYEMKTIEPNGPDIHVASLWQTDRLSVRFFQRTRETKIKNDENSALCKSNRIIKSFVSVCDLLLLCRKEQLIIFVIRWLLQSSTLCVQKERSNFLENTLETRDHVRKPSQKNREFPCFRNLHNLCYDYA